MELDTLEQMRKHDEDKGLFLSGDHFGRGHEGEGHHGLCFTNLVPDFTARHLTYEHDASRAFAGILQILTDLGHYRFFHGIPIRGRQFGRCLLWLDMRGCALRRQSEVPQWSWLAWKGSIFLFSDPLANETINITCYSLTENAQGVKHLQPVEGDYGEDNLDLNYQQIPETERTLLRPNFHLFFWAETATLVVRDERSGRDLLIEEASPRCKTNQSSSFVCARNRNLVGPQTFLRVRTMMWPREEHIDALLITWENGIAYRKCIAEVNLNTWEEARPNGRLIILG